MICTVTSAYTTTSTTPTINNSGLISETITVSPTDICIGGRSLHERLKIIEYKLNIPSRNIELENKCKKLKQLWLEYEETLLALQNWSHLEEP